jgi:hypothetical protein
MEIQILLLLGIRLKLLTHMGLLEIIQLLLMELVLDLHFKMVEIVKNY